MMQFRNPVFNAFGTIDCEVLHSTLSWIPFTASPNDVQENGRRIFADALSQARPYVPPPPVTPEEIITDERSRMVCSRFQAKAALHAAGLLDDVETAMATADRFAQIAWADAIEFRRNSPTIKAMAAALELTDAQIDNLFRAAMQIEA